jgi:muconolactone delta-isomerase
MQLLAIERELPTGIYARPGDLIRAEAAAVWALQKSGIVRQLWFTASDRRTVLLLECDSAIEGRRHLATLPFVERGLIEFSVLELRSYDGFERLIAGGPSPGQSAELSVEDPPEY